MQLAKSSWAALAFAALAVQCGASGGEQRAGRSAARPPNIVLIVADDLGWGELGCYGQRVIKTPNIDRLAEGGMRFTQFYAGAPVCAPSRCALLTGLHSGHAFVRNNFEVMPEGQMPIPDATVTLAERLRSAGYATCGVGKWGLGGPASTGEPNAQGFDHWFGFLCQRAAQHHYPTSLWRDRELVDLSANLQNNALYAPDLCADEAVKFVREPRDAPFFLYAAFTLPHMALQVPDDSLAQYAGHLPDAPYDGRQGYLPHKTPHAAYAAMVTRLDGYVGRICAALRELDLERDTVVIFISDNGPTYDRTGGADSDFFASSGPMRGRKGSVYEGGLRVPFIARWTDHIQANSVSDLPCAVWDFTPTLLALAKAAPPSGLDGVDLAPTLLARGAQSTHEFLYWEFPDYGGQQAARFGDWKAVRRDMALGHDAIELYDLATDIGEAHDRAAQEPDLVARALEIFRTAHRRSAEFPMPLVDAAR
jgi:arylsulfatase